MQVFFFNISIHTSIYLSPLNPYQGHRVGDACPGYCLAKAGWSLDRSPVCRHGKMTKNDNNRNVWTHENSQIRIPISKYEPRQKSNCHSNGKQLPWWPSSSNELQDKKKLHPPATPLDQEELQR